MDRGLEDGARQSVLTDACAATTIARGLFTLTESDPCPTPSAISMTQAGDYLYVGAFAETDLGEATPLVRIHKHG